MRGPQGAVDPTLEPIYHSDLSRHAPLAPPILLRNGSRIQYDRALARIHMGLAGISESRGNLDLALEHLDEAISMTEGFVDDTADDPATIELVASIHQSFARHFLRAGDVTLAREHAEQALAHHQRLSAADPLCVVWQRVVHQDESLLRRE